LPNEFNDAIGATASHRREQVVRDLAVVLPSDRALGIDLSVDPAERCGHPLDLDRVSLIEQAPDR